VNNKTTTNWTTGRYLGFCDSSEQQKNIPETASVVDRKSRSIEHNLVCPISSDFDF